MGREYTEEHVGFEMNDFNEGANYEPTKTIKRYAYKNLSTKQMFWMLEPIKQMTNCSHLKRDAAFDITKECIEVENDRFS